MYTISEVICIKCNKRWIAGRPTSVLLKYLECPSCGSVGYAIETGQVIDDEIHENLISEEVIQ